MGLPVILLCNKTQSQQIAADRSKSQQHTYLCICAFICAFNERHRMPWGGARGGARRGGGGDGAGGGGRIGESFGVDVNTGTKQHPHWQPASRDQLQAWKNRYNDRTAGPWGGYYIRQEHKGQGNVVGTYIRKRVKDRTKEREIRTSNKVYIMTDGGQFKLANPGQAKAFHTALNESHVPGEYESNVTYITQGSVGNIEIRRRIPQPTLGAVPPAMKYGQWRLAIQPDGGAGNYRRRKGFGDRTL